jgi:hypothetical protein
VVRGLSQFSISSRPHNGNQRALQIGNFWTY